MHAIFGYGSLILPMSTIARFDEGIVREIEEISQESDNRLKDILDFYLQEKQIENWKESDLTFLPAKICGFKRYYALEMESEGNQLTTVGADDNKFINGVVIFPLNEEEFKGISGTEEGYDRQEINKHDIDFYMEPENFEEIPEKVIFFTGTRHELIDMETDKTRDPNYHKFITNGIEMLADELIEGQDRQEEFCEEFISDFKKHTYEKNDGEWRPLIEIDNEN